MQHCTSVVSLPASFCRLSNLKKLDLSAPYTSMKLESLPERFGDLNLTEIDFSCCQQLDLGVIFDVIFKFEGLTKLGLGGLKMESLPERKPFTTFELLGLIPLSEGFGQLRSLVELNLSWCDALKELPTGISADPPSLCRPLPILHESCLN